MIKKPNSKSAVAYCRSTIPICINSSEFVAHIRGHVKYSAALGAVLHIQQSLAFRPQRSHLN